MGQMKRGHSLAPIREVLIFIVRLYVLIFAFQTDTAFAKSLQERSDDPRMIQSVASVQDK
jgi:hypothetical protein